MIDLLTQPWPWYVAGPLIGLMLPLLLFIGNKSFGVSSSFKHVCSASIPAGIEYFNYNWKKKTWNLWLVLGMIIGGFLGGVVFNNPEPIQLAAQTKQELASLGITDFNGLIPNDLFNWSNLLTLQGLTVMIAGGFLVGFGARYAGGCTSGHAITGMASFQKASLISTMGFFIGGLFITYVVLPLILN